METETIQQKSLMKALEETYKGSYLFMKYPELVNGKDKGDTHKYPFAEGGYSDITIVAETLRFLPLAMMSGAGFLMPMQAPEEQVTNLSGMLGKHDSPILLYDNSNAKHYTDLANSLPEKSLHVLHPYDNIAPEVYANDPDLLFMLNDKSNLHLFTDQIPQRQLFSLQDTNFLEDIVKQKAVVLKKTEGSAGDGLKILKSPKDLAKLNGFFSDVSQIIVEDYIEANHNYSIQFLIDKSNEIHYIGFGEQFMTSEGEYEGVVCYLEKEPEHELFTIGQNAAKKVAEMGYHGIVGFDILKDFQGEYYVIDPNIRPTAATPAFLMKDSLMPFFGDAVYLGSTSTKANSTQEVIQKVENKGGMVLCMSNQDNGLYKYFGLVGGIDYQDAISNWEKIEKV